MDIEDLLDLAIKAEEESYEFYVNASKKVRFSNVKQMLMDLAEEELKHKKIIISLKNGKLEVVENFSDLKLSDHLPLKDTIEENSDLQQVLQVAMSRERKEYEFYENLKKYVLGEDVKRILEFLAGQELSHKAKLENIYDDIVYREF